MSQFPHPPQSSSRRVGRGGMGNLQYDSVAQELDLGPERYLIPKDQISLNSSLKYTYAATRCGSQLARSDSLKQPSETYRYSSIPFNPQSGSPVHRSQPHKGPEVRTWEKWSSSIQQGKSKDLSAEVGIADKWRSKLFKSLTVEVDTIKGKGSVEIGLAEEWKTRVLKSLGGVENTHLKHGSYRKACEFGRRKA